MSTGVQPFTNHLPVQVRFGDGVAHELAPTLSGREVRRVLVVLDAGLEAGNPRVAASVQSLAGADIAVERYVKPRVSRRSRSSTRCRTRSPPPTPTGSWQSAAAR